MNEMVGQYIITCIVTGRNQARLSCLLLRSYFALMTISQGKISKMCIKNSMKTIFLIKSYFHHFFFVVVFLTPLKLTQKRSEKQID